ncbi:Gfo/Idh/MocA family oxidoreductase [Roseiconus nitratireducens]|uniref:Gfo/Idh/MocA family oxidoreductase n=1 Tax=Roseiconus nitratireducens TaxID=2605748 RepID=A0A5M6D2W6_9BACT|nr:Gfo/Idh/MocA family oxidoreductase [Roseiconus nitratireducens]KAA5539495.1 Gfo/Idh/MocA family oxidoreductase [Roseiconus nitratireducens]
MRAGIVGVGFMGWIHYLAYQRSNQADLVAFCSRNESKRRGDWTGIQGNFGPPGEQIDVSNLAVYETLDEMLTDESIDLIDICLPPSLHVEAIEKSLAAGKKVLCEKPLALTAEDARRLATLGAPSDVMVAHILPFIPEFGLLVQAATDGRWGKPIAGRFKRTISPPDWIPDFYNPDTVGGPLIDLHVHDAHLICLLFGMPESVETSCTRVDGVPKFYETLFRYADDRPVSAGGGVIDSPARGFTHGYEVSFERATVQFEFAAYADGTTASIPLVILHADGTVERPDLGEGDQIDHFVDEINAAAESVRSGKPSPMLSGELAANAIELCQWQSR